MYTKLVSIIFIKELEFTIKALFHSIMYQIEVV
jgi:hypothetical protein